MKLVRDFHTHTRYSRGFQAYGKHATGTVMENAEAALKKGLKELAISEHGMGHKLYGLNRLDFKALVEDVHRANDEFGPKGLRVLLGMEANLLNLSGDVDLDDEILKELDIVMMGYHYGAAQGGLGSKLEMFIMNPLSKFFKVGEAKMREKNTQAFIKAISKYPIKIITHPTAKLEVDIYDLARAAKEKDILLEINNKHRKLSVEEIVSIKDFFSGFILGSDAHRPEDVGNVDRAKEIAIEAGLDLGNIFNFKE
ncbi:MAG: PHP domain-containing protein [Tissierellia bacterium]|nr:PHP domain-containing protein [Tissierellia bacterium]